MSKFFKIADKSFDLYATHLWNNLEYIGDVDYHIDLDEDSPPYDLGCSITIQGIPVYWRYKDKNVTLENFNSDLSKVYLYTPLAYIDDFISQNHTRPVYKNLLHSLVPCFNKDGWFAPIYVDLIIHFYLTCDYLLNNYYFNYNIIELNLSLDLPNNSTFTLTNNKSYEILNQVKNIKSVTSAVFNKLGFGKTFNKNLFFCQLGVPSKLYSTFIKSKDANPSRYVTSYKLDCRPILSFSQVRPVGKNKYKILTSSSSETRKMIIAKLKAFNDMEIAYSDDLDKSALIRKSKKPLWLMSKSQDGEYILERVS